MLERSSQARVLPHSEGALAGVGSAEFLAVDWRERRGAGYFVRAGQSWYCTHRVISKCATKKHIECNKRITNGSFDEPFLTAATTAMLSHWNNVTLRLICGPQTVQPRTIETSSFAMIGMGDHSDGHCHWIQLPLKYPPPPTYQFGW